MKQFIKQHKYHFLIFTMLVIIACVSGLVAFSNTKTEQQNSTKTLKQTDAPSLERNTTASLINNGKQIPSTTDQLLIANYNLQKDTSSSPTTNEPLNRFQPEDDPPLAEIIKPSDYQNIITASSTVYDIMSKLQSQGKFTFKTKEFVGLGQFVEEINGVKNDPQANKYWIYYINGESAKVGISNYILKPDDLIEWKYETTNL